MNYKQGWKHPVVQTENCVCVFYFLILTQCLKEINQMFCMTWKCLWSFCCVQTSNKMHESCLINILPYILKDREHPFAKVLFTTSNSLHRRTEKFVFVIVLWEINRSASMTYKYWTPLWFDWNYRHISNTVFTILCANLILLLKGYAKVIHIQNIGLV